MGLGVCLSVCLSAFIVADLPAHCWCPCVCVLVCLFVEVSVCAVAGLTVMNSEYGCLCVNRSPALMCTHVCGPTDTEHLHDNIECNREKYILEAAKRSGGRH